MSQDVLPTLSRDVLLELPVEHRFVQDDERQIEDDGEQYERGEALDEDGEEAPDGPEQATLGSCRRTTSYSAARECFGGGGVLLRRGRLARFGGGDVFVVVVLVGVRTAILRSLAGRGSHRG